MNPLYMADVLQNAFFYLPEKELFRARIVCSDWDTHSKSEILKSCQATFKSTREVQEYMKIFSSNHPIHRMFKLIEPHKNHGIYETFFRAYGQKMKVLEITSGDFLNYYTAALEKYCPNLVELYLFVPANLETKKDLQILFPLRCHNLKVSSVALPFLTSELFEQITQSVENLTKLQIGSESSAFNDFVGTPQIDLLTKYLQYPCFRHLKILETALFLTDSCWIALSECEFRLQEFTAGLPQRVQTNSVRKFLQSQKETLTKLVTVHRKSNFEPSCFPIMPHMKFVNIAYTGPISKLFLKFPNLVSLELKNFCPHSLDLEWKENDDQPKITSSAMSLRLSISRQFNREIWPVVTQFGQLLPELKVLQIATRDLTNSDMQAIFKHMPNLEYIAIKQRQRLRVFEMSDECFTGVKTLTSDECLSFQNLKNLKTLILSESGNITDAAITRGLSKCTNLQNLSISSRSLTGQALTSIANNLENLQTLHIGFRYELVTLKAVKYLTKMLPKTKIQCTQFCSRRQHCLPRA